MLLEFLVRPPRDRGEAWGSLPGLLSLSCPYHVTPSLSSTITTESFSPQSRSPSSVLFSPVFTVFSDLWWRGLFFHRGLNTTRLPVFLLHSETIIIIVPRSTPSSNPTSKQIWFWHNEPALLTRLPSRTSRCHFLHVFSPLVPLCFSSFLSVGMRGGQDSSRRALLIWWCPRTDWVKRFWSHVEIPLQNLHQHLKFLLQDKDGFLSTVRIQCLLFLEWVWCALL